MKKLVAIILALMTLMCSVAFATNEKDAWTWCEMLPQDAVFTFDYSYMQPIPAKTTRIKDRCGRVVRTVCNTQYFTSEVSIAGFIKKDISTCWKYNNEEKMVIPVSLRKNVTYVYPIVTKSHAIVGLLWTTVENGELLIDAQLRPQVNCRKCFKITVYDDKSELAETGATYSLGTYLNIESFTNIVIYIELNGMVEYAQPIGVSYKKCGRKAYWQLNEYWHNEEKWREYRQYLLEITK